MKKIYVAFIDHHFEYGNEMTIFSHKVIEVPEWMEKGTLISQIEDELKGLYPKNAKCWFDILNIIEL